MKRQKKEFAKHKIKIPSFRSFRLKKDFFWLVDMLDWLSLVILGSVKFMIMSKKASKQRVIMTMVNVALLFETLIMPSLEIGNVKLRGKIDRAVEELVLKQRVPYLEWTFFERHA